MLLLIKLKYMDVCRKSFDVSTLVTVIIPESGINLFSIKEITNTFNDQLIFMIQY